MNLTILPSVLGALAVILASFVTAIITRSYTLRGLRLQEWQQWREDNKQLREEIKDLRGEIDNLEKKIDALSEDRNAIRHQRDEALESALSWQKRYDQEHAISNVFQQLYDSLSSGRIPDAVLLISIQEQLRQSGYLSRPAIPESGAGI